MAGVGVQGDWKNHPNQSITRPIPPGRARPPGWVGGGQIAARTWPDRRTGTTTG